jgi:hypothetical protein
MSKPRRADEIQRGIPLDTTAADLATRFRKFNFVLDNTAIVPAENLLSERAGLAVALV